MSSAIGLERCQDWGSAGLGGVFRVEWVRKDSLPFQLAQQLVNPWNDNKKVQISRDGQVGSSEFWAIFSKCLGKLHFGAHARVKEVVSGKMH